MLSAVGSRVALIHIGLLFDHYDDFYFHVNMVSVCLHEYMCDGSIAVRIRVDRDISDMLSLNR